MARGIIVWLLIMAIETVSGLLRGLFLAPVVGEITANRIGWPIGAAVVLLVSFVCSRWIGLTENRKLFALGFIWAVLTLLFEITIGFARGLDRERVVAEFVPWQGGLGVFSLLLMLAAPWLATKLKGTRE